jgi:hypothetical protein
MKDSFSPGDSPEAFLYSLRVLFFLVQTETLAITGSNSASFLGFLAAIVPLQIRTLGDTGVHFRLCRASSKACSSATDPMSSACPGRK